MSESNAGLLPPRYKLYTDGGGHKDGFGGAAAVVTDGDDTYLSTAIIAANSTTTDRMEFEALLAGLELITQIEDKKTLRMVSQIPVIWFSDRESLVLSCTWGPDGKTVYGRKAAKDLWARFEYYERKFELRPVHISRNSAPRQAQADFIASEARLLLKEWVLTLHHDGRLS